MSRTWPLGIASVGCTAASAFASPGLARTVLVLVGAVTALCLAYGSARSEARLDQAHARIIELSEELAATTETAEAARRQADRPIYERRNDEFGELVVKPTEDALKRSFRWLKSRPESAQGGKGAAE